MLRIASLAGALAVGVALATPANADAATDEYIQWLDRYPISYTSEQDAVNFGLTQCRKIRDGEPINSGEGHDGVVNDAYNTDVFDRANTSLSRYLVNAASFAMCPDTAQEALDAYHFGGALWDPEDPARAQKFLDSVCDVDRTSRNLCINVPLPQGVANHLGEHNNPATQLLFGELCRNYPSDEPDPDTPPCV